MDAVDERGPQSETLHYKLSDQLAETSMFIYGMRG